MKTRIITIDGPAGTGKSTVAKTVAEKLGYTFLDTGALYRTCALAVDKINGDIENEEECAKIVAGINIKLFGSKVFLDGIDVSKDIRTNRISTLSSKIAAHPSVRNLMLNIQRSFPKFSSIVAEGRDTGSVVFPDADVKIYLDASLEERAKRRHNEMILKGISVPIEQIINDVKERDDRDRTRESSPLVIPYNSTVVDTTHMNLDEVIETVLKEIKKKLPD
ncbi:MAG TPA: (d)CMP kinase [Desulfomonilia bacterium]